MTKIPPAKTIRIVQSSCIRRNLLVTSLLRIFVVVSAAIRGVVAGVVVLTLAPVPELRISQRVGGMHFALFQGAFEGAFCTLSRFFLLYLSSIL